MPNNKVLASYGNLVISKDFVEGKADQRNDQLWKKGEPDAEGFFTLGFLGHQEPNVITAISATGLENQGNITLRWITTKSLSILAGMLCLMMSSLLKRLH